MLRSRNCYLMQFINIVDSNDKSIVITSQKTLQPIQNIYIALEKASPCMPGLVLQ